MLYIAAQIFFYAMIGVASYFFLMAFANILEMKLRTSSPSVKSGVFVSVLIPARNEENNIERCVNSLLNQDYNDYEIIIIDDNSNDKTFEIISKLADQNERVTALKGKPLPPDWYGKSFATEQMIPHAKGEILLFTDADTFHNPTSVSWAVTNMQKTGADLISGYAGQILKSFGERLTVPLIFFLTGFLIPMFLNRIVKLGYFSLAVGQYIAVKKISFVKVGGYSTVKNKTSEDVFLARLMKSSGYKTEFLDISNQVLCRMYSSGKEAITGIGKNIYDFFGKNPFPLIMNAVAILLFFCLPLPLFIALLVLSYLEIFSNPFFIHLIIVLILHTLTWLILFIGRRISIHNTLYWPIMYFNLLFMVLWSFYRTLSGRGFVWKDRVVT